MSTTDHPTPRSRTGQLVDVIGWRLPEVVLIATSVLLGALVTKWLLVMAAPLLLLIVADLVTQRTAERQAEDRRNRRAAESDEDDSSESGETR